MPAPDPLDNLGPSLTAESDAVTRRFDDAARFTRGIAPRPAGPTAIRDSFSFPPADHALLAEIRKRCIAVGTVVSKSQIVRAGLHALAALPNSDLASTIARHEPRKPGPRAAHAQGCEPGPPPSLRFGTPE